MNSQAVPDVRVSVTRAFVWRDLKRTKKKTRYRKPIDQQDIQYKRDKQYNKRFSMRSCYKLLIAMFASRPTLEPQTKGFPSVSPTRGVLVFVLQCLSVL